jgi:tetratricopeptide (TPR) repeat protein
VLAQLLKQVGSLLQSGAAVGRRNEDRRGPEWQDSAQTALEAGHLERAIELLTPHVSRADAPAEALRLTGQAFARIGRLEDARIALSRSLARQESPAARADLGNVLQLLGEPAEAEREYRRSLAADRSQAGVWHNLALALARKDAIAEAAGCLDEALSLEPAFAEAIRAYGSFAPRMPDLWDRLASHCDRALRAAPGHPVALEATGFMRLKCDLDASGAVEAFEGAIRAGGDGADLYGNMGIALQDLGRIPESLAAYDRALAREPHNPVHRWHRSLALLLAGRFEEGWPDYELRFISEDAPKRRLTLPRWDGQTLPEGAILITAEQGLGDEIMFASCIPDLLALGARCVIECHPKLECLFRRSFPEASVRRGTPLEVPGWLAEFPELRSYAPAGSLPLRFRRSPTEFPAHHGYLKADPAKVSVWRSRLEALGPGPKLGLSWRGGTAKTRSKLRSPGAAHLVDLLREPGAEWVSLQYDATEDEARALSAAAGTKVHHWPEAIADYDETAALLCALDLTVSVCTALIHLGGALGRPVWVMAPLSPEWRYGLYWDVMPWYPSVRILRQKSPYGWPELMGRVKNELAAWRRAA